MQTKCLHSNKIQLDPKLFGYEEIDDLLVPKKINIILPPLNELVPNCTCKVCVNNLCICVANEIPYCSFCSCQKCSTCKNKYSEKNIIENEFDSDIYSEDES